MGLFNSKPKAAVVVFLGTNCDRDTKIALEKTGFKADYIFHTETNMVGYDLIALPGGFSFGDYIGAGRLAKLSPIMKAVKKEAGKKFILGICNGFQILCESGLLEGALITNTGGKFISKDQNLIVENPKMLGTKEITLPIAHKEGMFQVEKNTLKKLEAENSIFLRYNGNPNGSINDIAGLYKQKEKIMGLMPHPERAINRACSGTDGKKIFEFIKKEI